VGADETAAPLLQPIHDAGEVDHTDRSIASRFGLPPNRIDILTGVSGLTFDRAWANRIEEEIDAVRVPVIGLEDLLENKQASGRDKDRADLKGLEGKN
jgi:hypothetical protein